MKRALVERYMVVVLFILVFITFSLAQRDSKKLEKLYTNVYKISDRLFSALRLQKYN